ncbi:MAG TPA: site-2 protease family protein [Longimicrobiales bacterium]|nr:site-2 protease family protein [Longimicrobiales bacterium]
MRGFRLGRVFGFEIRIDSSWFILFALILWTFSYIVFPQQVPGRDVATYLIMGLTGTLLFFVSLLLHEIAHSLVARAKDIPVEGITLFLFGGMAHTRMEAETPGDEFLIAGAGPVMSVLIAVVLGGIWYLGSGAGFDPAVLAVLQYIAALNIILAVFNLLPGFPLDGGRLFRAIVWKATGDMNRATRVASFGGRILAYILMAFGLMSAFAGNVLGGMWMVFIGWFLRNAAISSYQQHILLNVLSGVRASQAMTPDPDTVPSHATVRELADEYFMRRRHAAYPVVDGSTTVGLVTLQAVREVPREEWDTRTAGDIMIPVGDEVVVRADDAMVAVMDRLNASPARRVLVMRDGDLLGIITPSDITFWLERARQEGKGPARGR